jgi:hypothetical protein
MLNHHKFDDKNDFFKEETKKFFKFIFSCSQKNGQCFVLFCLHFELMWLIMIVQPGNTKGGSSTVPLTSCLTGLESAV